MVQISSGTQNGGQNAVSVEEERKVSDSEADVQRTLSQSGLELLLVRRNLLTAWVLQLEDFVDLVASATGLLANVRIVFFQNRAVSRK